MANKKEVRDFLLKTPYQCGGLTPLWPAQIYVTNPFHFLVYLFSEAGDLEDYIRQLKGPLFQEKAYTKIGNPLFMADTPERL